MHELAIDYYDCSSTQTTHKDIEELKTNFAAFHQQLFGESEQLFALLIKQHQQLKGGVMVSATTQAFYIEQLWLDESIRGMGVGSELITMLIQLAKQQDITTIFAKNHEPSATAFFPKLGFTTIATVPQYILSHDLHFYRLNIE